MINQMILYFRCLDLWYAQTILPSHLTFYFSEIVQQEQSENADEPIALERTPSVAAESKEVVKVSTELSASEPLTDAKDGATAPTDAGIKRTGDNVKLASASKKAATADE
jgi:hypothetical protein